MGRKGLSPLAGLAGKALKKRKAVGAGLKATQGKSPADDFFAQFTRRRQQQEAEQEQARGQLRERLQAGEKGGIFSRLFGA